MSEWPTIHPEPRSRSARNVAQRVTRPVAVEKLIYGKRSQIASRKDVLQMIFFGRLGIFYPPKSRRFL
jgi:hypothetical protein